MSWVYLFCAGIFEIVWAVTLKFTYGFTKLWPTVGTFSAGLISFYLLALALKQIPIGTAYAIWTGIGAVGTVILGIIFFKEPATLSRILCISLIMIGILGLKMTSSP